MGTQFELGTELQIWTKRPSSLPCRLLSLPTLFHRSLVARLPGSRGQGGGNFDPPGHLDPPHPLVWLLEK